MPSLVAAPLKVLRDSWGLYLTVLKVIVPTLIAVKIAEELGAVALLGAAMAPLMGLVGLPGEMGLAWAATALLGLYAGFGVLAGLLAETPLTVAQASILGSMMLITHALPVEQRICRRAGVGLVPSTLLRILGALAYGAILNATASGLGVLQDAAVPLLPEVGTGGGLGAWLWDNVQALLWMFVVILALLALLRLFDAVGLTRLLGRALAPLLRLMGMGERAAPLTVIGMLLGITYGSSLILRETEAGTLPRRDVFLSISFMCLSHAVIEDTLLVMALGGHWFPLLVGRFLFAVAVVALLARLLAALPDRVFERWLMAGRPPAPAAA